MVLEEGRSLRTAEAKKASYAVSKSLNSLGLTKVKSSLGALPFWL